MIEPFIETEPSEADSEVALLIGQIKAARQQLTLSEAALAEIEKSLGTASAQTT